MALKNEIAATLKAIRQQRGLSYDDLNESTFRTSLSLIERGKAGVTIEKLSSLAHALDFDLIAFVAMCVALERGHSPDEALATAQYELDQFKAVGGLNLLQEQWEDGNPVSRPPGKPAKKKNMSAVLQLKAEGKTQAEIVRILSLSPSTVNRYWHSDA